VRKPPSGSPSVLHPLGERRGPPHAFLSLGRRRFARGRQLPLPCTGGVAPPQPVSAGPPDRGPGEGCREGAGTGAPCAGCRRVRGHLARGDRFGFPGAPRFVHSERRRPGPRDRGARRPGRDAPRSGRAAGCADVARIRAGTAAQGDRSRASPVSTGMRSPSRIDAWHLRHESRQYQVLRRRRRSITKRVCFAKAELLSVLAANAIFPVENQLKRLLGFVLPLTNTCAGT